MIKSDALYDYLFDQGLQPEYVEEDTQIVVCCPMCEDDRPRLYVSSETGAFICFHCHEQGNLHQFLMRVCNLDGNEAFEQGRLIRGSREDEIDYFEHREERKKEVTAVLTLPRQFHTIDRAAPVQFLKYLEKRHVSPELAINRGIGYAVTGRYAYRVIVPVKNDGHLYTYIGRTVLTQCPNCTELVDDCTCRPYKYPKVLTPTKKQGAQPSHTLYNLEVVHRTRPERLVVVEGVFDALRLPTSSVALLGSSASATQVTLIAGLARGREVILALDPDEAGYKGTLKVADLLSSEMVKVRVALLPEGEDVGSIDQPTLDRCLQEARPYIV